MPNKSDIAIIGAGAAGIFAAINAAERLPNAKITIFEASGKALSKVLISGGGRCNVTNHTPEPQQMVQNYPRGQRELLGPLTVFGVRETITWFEKRGVPLKTEKDKRMFPLSNTSQTIADCLLFEAKRLNVEIKYGEKVQSIRKETCEDKTLSEHKDAKTEKFVLCSKSGEYTTSCLLLASGGNEKSFSLAESLGHRIIPAVPSLFTFSIENPLLSELSGVSFQDVETKLTIGKKKSSHRGPLLITHWGLSGPAVIVLSSKAARELHEVSYNTTLVVDFIPKYSFEEASILLTNVRTENLQKKISALNPFSLPTSFWERLITIFHQDTNGQNKANHEINIQYQELSKGKIEQLIHRLKSYPLEITAKGVFKEEFVTAGGVSLKEVNFKTMESKLVKNLFFAGEVLDIDGVTGGFNFQSAWTTAWIGSQNILKPAISS